MKSQLRNDQNDAFSQKEESSALLSVSNMKILAQTQYSKAEQESQAISSDIESSKVPESLINKAEILQTQVEALNKELALVQRLITHRREKEKQKARQKQKRSVFQKDIQRIESETSESGVTAQNIPGKSNIVHENPGELSVKITSDQSQSGITHQIGDYSYQNMRRNLPRDTFGKQSIGNSEETFSIKQNTQQIRHHHEISFAADQRSQNVHTASHQNSTRRVIQQESLLSYDNGSEERKADCRIDETVDSFTSQKQLTQNFTKNMQCIKTDFSVPSVNSNTKKTILLQGVHNIGQTEIKESTQQTVISQLVIQTDTKSKQNAERNQTQNSPTQSVAESQQSDGAPEQPHFPYQSTEHLVIDHNPQLGTANPNVNRNSSAIEIGFDLTDRQRFSKSVSENKEEIDVRISEMDLSHLNKQLQITDNMLSNESINHEPGELVQIDSGRESSHKKSTEGQFQTQQKNEMEVSKRFDGLSKLVAEIDQNLKSPDFFPPSPSINTHNIRIQEDMYSSRNDIQLKPPVTSVPSQNKTSNLDKSSFINKIRNQQKIEVGVVELQINLKKVITPKQNITDQQLSTGQQSNIFEKSGNATRKTLSNIQETKADEISSVGKITHTQTHQRKQESNLPADAFNRLNPKAPNVNNFPTPRRFNQEGEIINLGDRVAQTLQDFLDKAISPSNEIQIYQNLTPEQPINVQEMKTINKNSEVDYENRVTPHITPLKPQVHLHKERSHNPQRQPSKSDPIPKQGSPQKSRYYQDHERQQSQQDLLKTHTQNYSTSDPMPTQPNIQDDRLPQQPTLNNSHKEQVSQESRPGLSITHVLAKPVENDELEPNLPNLSSILPSHMPLRITRKEVFQIAEQGPVNIQLNQGFKNHFRTLPTEKINRDSQKYMQTAQDDYSDGANIQPTTQLQVNQKALPQIRNPPRHQDIHDLYDNRHPTNSSANHRSVHQQSTSKERKGSRHNSNERQILETMQTHENIQKDTATMNLLPINFVQVDANTLDPNQQYFILEGKIGALQFPSTHRAPSSLFKDQKVNNFVLPTVRSKPNLNNNALPQLNSIERQTDRTPPKKIRQELNTGSAFARKSNSHHVNIDTPLTKAAQIYATAYNPSTGILKGSGRIRDQMYYPAMVEQVNFDSQTSTQSKETPMPIRRRIKHITASPKPIKSNPEIENADSQVRSLIEEFELRSSQGDPKAGLTLHKLRLHHPLFSKLSMNAFKYMVENSYIFKLKPGQFIYREHAAAAPNLYFILYGSFVCQTKQSGQFGSIMCVGHTLGEEVIFAGDGTNEVYRTESVVSQDFSCVLQINVKTMQLMRLQRHVGAGGGNLSKDFAILDYILESHYLQKSDWRMQVGTTSDSRSIEKESRLSQQNILYSERNTTRRGKSEGKTGRRN